MAAAACREPAADGLTFEVSDPVSPVVAVVCHNDVREIILDSLGRGHYAFTGGDAAYLRIFYGSDSRTVYVENGDRAVISFAGNDFNGSFGFDGDKAPAAEYLAANVLTALPDEDYALDFGEFHSKIQDKTDEALERLQACDLRGTGDFAAMEEGRIRYSFGLQLLMYPMAHVIMARDPAYRPGEEYFEVIRGYATENPMYADIDEYREFMAESAHVLDPEGRGIDDLYPKLVAEMKYIVANFSDDKVRQTLLHHIAVPYIDSFGIDGIEEMSGIYKKYVTDPARTAEFDAAYWKWFNKGKKPAL